MKRILFFLILLCLEKSLHAQAPRSPYIYTIKADSVKITNTCDTAELIIENHTQTVPGFLFNKGRGRTEFRRITQLNDTTVIIGGDSIHLGRGNKNFANADLTLTGDRVHNGAFHNLTLADFDWIDMYSNTADGMSSSELALGYGLYFHHQANGTPLTSLMSLDENKVTLKLPESNYQDAGMELSRKSFDLHTRYSYGNSSTIQAYLEDNEGTLDLDILNQGGHLRMENSDSGGSFRITLDRGDSATFSQSDGFGVNTIYIQAKDKFVFRNRSVNDFRLIGLPASNTSSDSMLVIGNNGQVKKRPQSSTRKSITVTAASYTVPADVDVVFVNCTSDVATISLPSGSLDREITIKNLNTTNSVALSGLDPSESNTIATRGAITVKYTGSAWVGISKY
jgi:hypothetical protein